MLASHDKGLLQFMKQYIPNGMEYLNQNSCLLHRRPSKFCEGKTRQNFGLMHKPIQLSCRTVLLGGSHLEDGHRKHLGIISKGRTNL